MTTQERRLLAKEIAKELIKYQDKVLTVEDIMIMFNLKTKNGVYNRIKKGLPARKKKGMGIYFMESEVIQFLKSTTYSK